MNRSRKTADLASHGNIFVDIANDRVGIGTTQPTHKVDLDGSFKLHDGSGYGNHITFTQNPPTITFPTGPLANLSKTPTLVFGDRTSGGDLKIYQDYYSLHVRHLGPSGFHIGSQASHLVISGSNGSNAVQPAIRIDPGATEGVKLYSGGTQRFETVGYGVTVLGTTETQELNVTGISTFSDDVFFFGTNPSNTSNKILFDKSNNQMRFFDSTKADFGQSGDLRIYHESAVSYIDCTNSNPLHIQANDLRIRKQDGGEEMITAFANGAVKLYHDGTERLATTHNSVSITGNLQVSQSISYGSQLQCNGDVNFNGDNYNILFDKSDSTLEFADNARLRIGVGNDLQIFHDGTDTRFTNNQDHNIIKITSSEELEIYKDQVKTVGITSFINMPSPTGGQAMNHTGGRIRVRSNQTDDPVAMSLGMFAAPPSGDPNVGLCTVILQSNSAKRPELRFDNIHNGNWHESNGNTQHLRLIWTAPNENSTTPEVCELKPIVANNATGSFSSFRIRTTDNSTGLKNVATLNTFGQTFYIDNSVSLSTSSNGLAVPDNLHHYLDTDTRIRFPQNDKITLEAGGTTRLQTTSTGIQVDNILLLYGAAGNPGRLRLQEGGALCEIMIARNTDSSSFLYFKTEIGGSVDTRVVIDGSGHLRPHVDSTYDLGITGTRWRNVYADTLYGDGSNITDVTATRVTATDQSSDTTCFPLFVQATTGDLTPHTGTNLAFNSATGALTATSFSGDGSNLTAVNATTLDSIDSSSFLNLGADNAVTNYNNRTQWYSNSAIDSGSSQQASLEVFQSTAQADAFMAFHVSSDFAAYFGLDGGTNDFAVGGWSMGAVSNKVWHAGNDGSGSGLDADTLDGVQSAGFIRSDQNDTFSGDLTSSGSARILLQKTDNNVADHIIFYNGTTRVGEIGVEDNSWLRLNQETAKNIYTPRYIRADGGFFVDGSSKGINGDGNFVNGTIAGASDYGTLIRSDASDTITKGSTWVLNHDLADWGFRFSNGNGTNAHVYMSHSTHGMHIRNDSSGTGQYLLDVYANNGNRFRIRGGDAYVTSNGNAMWHAGNDGSGSGLDADTVDGVQGGNFLRNDTDNAVTNHDVQVRFYSDTSVHTTSAYQASLEVYQSSAGSDAFMAFHVAGDFAAYLGLDGNINDFAVGGWSMGNNRYRIWHQGNDGSGSGLDADTLDGQQGSYYKDVPSGTVMVFRQNSAPTGWTKSTSNNNKAMRIVSGNVGSGGSNSFSTAFNSSRGTSGGSVSNHTLTTAQMPSHTHTGVAATHDSNSAGSQGYPAGNQHNRHRSTDRPQNNNMAAASHKNTGSTNSHNHGFSNPSINLNVQYLDFIICTRS